MRHRVLHTPLWACKLALLFSCGAAHAEIYKWVDEQGRTHYSQNKADAERAKGTQVDIRKHAPAHVESRDYWDYVTDKSKRQRRTEASADDQESSGPANPAGTPVAAEKRYDGTDDAARCEYARDVLSGKLRLANGEAMDEHERKTAEADTVRFCR
jgi:hypothetical protein